MKYPLEAFDILVTVTINPLKNNITLISEEVINKYIDTANENKERVRLLLIEEAFIQDNEISLELLIQQYQSSLIRLLDTIFHYEQNSNAASELTVGLFIAIGKILEELLSFIEKYFLKYFDIDQKAPDNLVLSENKQFTHQTEKLKQLVQLTPTEQNLVKIVLSFISNSISNTKTDLVTYRKLLYKKELILELNNLFLKKSVFLSLKELLLYFNYNHADFFRYLIQELQETQQTSETLEAKIEALKYQRKIIRQTVLKADAGLFFQLSSIKEQFLSWIEEEIIFRESQINHLVPLPAKKDTETIFESKVITSLSVSQLAFLLRILHLGKVFINNKQADMVRVIASNFSTTQAKDISFGSLNGKYFKHELFTKKSVKDILLRLIQVINKIEE